MADPDRDERRRELRSGRAARSGGIVSALVDFLRANGKWWVAPLLIALLLIGLAFLLGGTAAGPFIYSVY